MNSRQSVLRKVTATKLLIRTGEKNIVPQFDTAVRDFVDNFDPFFSNIYIHGRVSGTKNKPTASV